MRPLGIQYIKVCVLSALISDINYQCDSSTKNLVLQMHTNTDKKKF